MKPTKTLDKWQFVFTVNRDFMHNQLGWHIVNIGIFKLTSIPREGTIATKDNYKGFWWRFNLWLPVEKN